MRCTPTQTACSLYVLFVLVCTRSGLIVVIINNPCKYTNSLPALVQIMCNFHIFRVRFQLQTQPIQLFVQSTDGSHFCTTLPYFSKPKELASVVEAKLGIPHSQQLLMCRQKKINSNMLLVEQNITTGSIILVQTGIKGGSGIIGVSDSI